MRTKTKSQGKPAAGQACSNKSRRSVIVFFVLATIAIALIDVFGWPKKPAETNVLNGVPLYGTGLAPDVAAMLSKRGSSAAPISAPVITPQNADEFAGVPKDPVQQYSRGMPRPTLKH